jgi:hypothetical protein
MCTSWQEIGSNSYLRALLYSVRIICRCVVPQSRHGYSLILGCFPLGALPKRLSPVRSRSVSPRYAAPTATERLPDTTSQQPCNFNSLICLAPRCIYHLINNQIAGQLGSLAAGMQGFLKRGAPGPCPPFGIITCIHPHPRTRATFHRSSENEQLSIALLKKNSLTISESLL